MASMAKVKDRFNAEEVRLYRKHFERFDLNGDGVISTRELRRVSKQLGYRLTEDQVQEIMKANDLDSNGCLTFDEFILAMPANTKHITEQEHRVAEVRRKFMEFDRDGNGKISAEEAHGILQKELAFSPQQSIELVRKYDKNGDGQLGYEEFVRFYTKVRAKAERIRDMFHEFDRDNSGSVSIEEAKFMLRKLDMPDDEIETLVCVYDKNKDGELQYEEFVNFLFHM